MKVSVIIVTYNSGPLALDCIAAALASTVPVEVLVSDNGSTDGAMAALADWATREPRLQLLRHGANLGFAAANNRAALRARGDYVLLLNPDCVLASDAIAHLVQALEAAPDGAMAGGLIMNPDGTEQAGCRRHLPTWARMARSALGLGKRNRSYLLVGAPLPDAPAKVEAISGALMLVRTSAWQSLGPMDESYFLHWEDLDYCARCKAAGLGILFVPDARAVHYKGRSSAAIPWRVEAYKHRGMLRYFAKFHGQGWRRTLLPLLAVALALRYGAKTLSLLLRGSVAASSQPDTPLPLDTGRRPLVWVFGASSIVGAYLLPRLVAAGYRVLAFSRNPPPHGESPSILWRKWDIAQGLSGSDEGSPQSVIHLAPLPLLAPLLSFLAEAGVSRVLAFGTTSRFTKLDSTDAGDKRLAESMAGAEAAIARDCSALGIRWAVFRPTLTYSLGRDKNVSTLLRFLRRFRFFPLPGSGAGLRQPVHADDLAAACLRILATPSAWNRAYDLGGGEVLSFRQMVGRLFALAGQQDRVFKVPGLVWRPLLAVIRLLPRYRHLTSAMALRTDQHMVFDGAPAQAAFGYAPRRFLQ